ncbi:MAG: FAD-dependent oxidoreductase [Desulfarculaceae bacterium]|jgi:protoporphyrinogen oxidase
MSDYAHTIILGGGLTGLSLARFLGGDTLVLEAGERPGGLCRSFSKDGFTYDIGGHILFSRDQDLLNTLINWLGDNLHQRRRNNQIWFRDRFVKYPFENGLYALDKQDVFECLMGFLNREQGEPANLEQWCRFRFGEGIAGKYLIPYNDKIWKRAARDISVHWVERIPSPPTEDIIKSAIGIETEGYTHQLNFFYPRQGGIEALIHSLAGDARILTGFRASRIRKKGKDWEVSDGTRTLGCRRLLSTIPVFELAAALEGVPPAVQGALDALVYNQVVLVMIGVNHPGLMDKSAIYIPSPDKLAHRVCYMGYFSQQNAPPGCSHLVAEITAPPGDPLLSISDDGLVQRVLADVKDICGITEAEVIASEVRRIKYAYVVYDLDYLKNRQTVFDYLGEVGIPCCGRFGSFEYLNMDQCVQRAQDLAQTLSAEKD